MEEGIKHVFFDLDHTLWDFDKNSKIAYQMIFRAYNIDLELDLFLKEYELINLEYWKKYRNNEVSKIALRRGRLNDSFNKFGLKFTLEKIDQIAEDYIKYLPLNNHLIEGTNDLLTYLSDKYQLHIITNGFKEVQRLKLKQSGIEKYFSTITNSEEAGVKKPNSKIFAHALEKAKASKVESIMIGDNFEADIQGAESFGIKSICFNYHNEIISSRYNVINNLSEVKNYL